MRYVCAVGAVCYQCDAETMRTWIEDEFRLALTLFWCIHTAARLPFVTQIQMWPANKGSSVRSNLKPKADFLNCCCLFVLNMRVFTKSTSSFIWNNEESEKVPQKALTFTYHRSGFLPVYGGKCSLSDWSLAGVEGGIGGLVLSSSDKLQGELEQKQAVSTEEQCGIE